MASHVTNVAVSIQVKVNCMRDVFCSNHACDR